MKIKAYFSPIVKEEEKQFDKSIVVMVDVLRASTTVCAALFNGAKEVIPTVSSEQAMKIYADLDRSIRFIGGEINAIRPDGFDAGNSPADYSKDKCNGKTIILTTSNGAKLFTQLKGAKLRIVASFANFSIVLKKIQQLLSDNIENNFFDYLEFFCAGNNGLFSYEDSLCIGGLIHNIIKENEINFELNDSADAARNLYDYHQDNLFDFLRNSDHGKRLTSLGFQSDLDICLAFDNFPVLPIIEGISIKKSII
jgi:2-phosphosulfolactate phosphatase